VKAEVLSTVVGDGYAEVVERGSEGSRGISLYGDRLVVWTERGSGREALLDVLLDKYNAELVYEVLKRIKDGARFGLVFDVLTNAEMCIGADGRIHFCDEGFDYIALGHE
jgi:hypothetical protein